MTSSPLIGGPWDWECEGMFKFAGWLLVVACTLYGSVVVAAAVAGILVLNGGDD